MLTHSEPGQCQSIITTIEELHPQCRLLRYSKNQGAIEDFGSMQEALEDILYP